MTRSTTKKAPAPKGEGSKLAASKAEKQNRDDGLRQAYSEATTTLRKAHREEFTKLYVAAAKARGIDYTPAPTEEEKAETQLKALLEKYPNLRDKVRTAVAVQLDEDDPVVGTQAEHDAETAGVIPETGFQENI